MPSACAHYVFDGDGEGLTDPLTDPDPDGDSFGVAFGGGSGAHTVEAARARSPTTVVIAPTEALPVGASLPTTPWASAASAL